MTIVPPPPEPVTGPASRVDGCPGCVTNTEAPHTWWPTTHGYECAYRCTDCDHTWTTGWGF